MTDEEYQLQGKDKPLVPATATGAATSLEVSAVFPPCPFNSLVHSLFFSRRPPAVVGSIIPISIDAIKCHSIRTLPHIFEEGVEASTPPIADRDSPAAVQMEVPGSRLVAPFDHATPGRVGWCLPMIPGLGLHSFGAYGALEAPARFRGPEAKASDRHEGSFSTVAQAFPNRRVALGVREFDCHEPTKPFSRDVCSFRAADCSLTAPAGHGAAGVERFLPGHRGVTAVAHTVPRGAFPQVRGAGYDHELSKPVSGEVNESGHA